MNSKTAECVYDDDINTNPAFKHLVRCRRWSREIVKAAFSEAVTAVLSRGTLVDVNISECSNNVVGDYQVASGSNNILIVLEHFSPCSVTALCRYLLS